MRLDLGDKRQSIILYASYLQLTCVETTMLCDKGGGREEWTKQHRVGTVIHNQITVVPGRFHVMQSGANFTFNQHAVVCFGRVLFHKRANSAFPTHCRFSYPP